MNFATYITKTIIIVISRIETYGIVLVAVCLICPKSYAQDMGIKIPKLEAPKPATIGQVPIIGFQGMTGV